MGVAASAQISDHSSAVNQTHHQKYLVEDPFQIARKISRSALARRLLVTPGVGSVDPVNIEAVIGALGGRFDPAEAAIIERMLRESGGTIPDAQMIEEVGLALAIHRRERG